MGSAPPDDGHDGPGGDGKHCESCGDEGVELTLLRRLYITPETWDQAGRVEPGDLEWWCDVCRTHYPHSDPHPEAAEDGGGTTGS